MTIKEAINWIINLRDAIGRPQHQELWHYEQALEEIKDMLKARLLEEGWVDDEEMH